MAQEKKAPQYAAKQLRLTNEEILEKFAVYWAEVDSVMNHVKSSDRMMETIMANQSKAHLKMKSLQRQMDILILTNNMQNDKVNLILIFILFIISIGIWFWVLTA